MSKGIIFDIKEFTVHDGPGVRTTVFFKGCPLHCLWCHNPEGIGKKPQLLITKTGCLHCGKCEQPCTHPECAPFDRCTKICPKGLIKIAGEEVDAQELANQLKKQAPFLADGGITLSGGEPMYQPEFLMQLLHHLQPMHTVIETSGHVSPEIFQMAAKACSLIYLDVKHMDSAVHRRLTGVGNGLIQKNLSWMLSQKRPFVVRVPLIPELNDSKENLTALAQKLEGAKAPVKVEFLPYNPFTGAKYEMAEMKFSLKHIDGNQYHPQIPIEEFQKRDIPFELL